MRVDASMGVRHLVRQLGLTPTRIVLCAVNVERGAELESWSLGQIPRMSGDWRGKPGEELKDE